MPRRTDPAPQPSHDDLQRAAGYFWSLAQEQALHPEELAELIRRLASGELCENVLPQRFLPLAGPTYALLQDAGTTARRTAPAADLFETA